MDELVFPQNIKIEELTDIAGKIAIEPLERGFGTTLGNSLRPSVRDSRRGCSARPLCGQVSRVRYD